MKVYVITSGYYSDYGIDTIFTDEGQAALFLAAHKELDNGRIEAYETDEVKLEGKVYYGLYIYISNKNGRYLNDVSDTIVSASPIVKTITYGKKHIAVLLPVHKYYYDRADIVKIAKEWITAHYEEIDSLISANNTTLLTKGEKKQ